jgi:hypothetical protein
MQSPICNFGNCQRRRDLRRFVKATPGGQMRIAIRLSVCLLLCTLNSRVASTAQTVTLLCSGTFQAVEFYGPVTPTKETIIVDYGLRTVSGTPGSPYPFTSLSETKIEFSNSYVAKTNIPMIAGGKIDRVSGDTTIIVRRQDQPEGISIFYALSCMPARPAF